VNAVVDWNGASASVGGVRRTAVLLTALSIASLRVDVTYSIYSSS